MQHSRVVNFEDIDELVIIWGIGEVLQANTSFFMVFHHNHSFNQTSEDFEIVVLSGKHTLSKFDTWCIFWILNSDQLSDSNEKTHCLLILR